MFEPNIKILVVDDFASIREMTMRALRELGFNNFVEASDGQIAWNMIINRNPEVDLIICDWNMPNCSGIEFVKKLKSAERFRHIPVVMSTTKADKEAVLEAIGSGIDNFIVKPFTSETFRQKLEAVYKAIQTKK